MSKKKRNSNNYNNITDLHKVYGLFGGLVLTKYGSVIGGLRLYGRDPDSMLRDDHLGLSLIASNIYKRIPQKVIITQLYTHYDGFIVEPIERTHHITKMTVERATDHINNKNLSSSEIHHYFEWMPDESLNQLNLISLIRHLGKSLFDKQSRQIIKEQFSYSDAILVQYDALVSQVRSLNRLIHEVCEKWNGVVKAEVLTERDIWSSCRFLATGNSELIQSGHKEFIPIEEWDRKLNSGEINPVMFDGVDMLKVNGDTPRYIRIASVTNFGKQVIPGLWSYDDEAIMWTKNNFSILTRWKPISAFQKALMFKQKENELERASLNLFDMVTGNDRKSSMEKKALMKPAIAQKYEELAEAEMLDDSYGNFHSHIFIFDKDPQRVIETSQLINKAALSSSLSLVWESAYLQDTFEMMQLAGGKSSLRDTLLTNTQMGAASLITKRVTGSRSEPDIPNEEAQLVLECIDKTPFYLNFTAGEKPVIIGVGPSGTGKTFFKNIAASHFLKYGGLLRSIDIDSGSETLADLYGNDGGIFSINNDEIKGFNSFCVCQGVQDLQFLSHYKSMMLSMMKLNDDPRLQELEKGEQQWLDQAILKVLQMPRELQRLGTVVKHLPDDLAEKFQRWVYASNHHEHDGINAAFFDSQLDSVGVLDKRVATFNLQGLKDIPELYSLVVKEIVYRITRAFESEELLSLPKQLDIDEAHHFLKDRENSEFVIRAGRTWRKWLARISLWSQSPKEFMALDMWDALRAAAGTFVFMADPKMEVSVYQDAFKLTEGECNAIKNLIPKKEAYIIQPYIGVSKKVLIDVDPYQYVMATSRPKEMLMRKSYVNKYGFEEGINKTIENLLAPESQALDMKKQAIEIQRNLMYRGAQ